MAVRPALNLRIADYLLESRLIGEADHRRAVEYARDRNRRIEESLIELDILAEQDLLPAISKLHETQFISTERMSKAKVDRNAIRLVNKKVAELYGVYPLLYEPGTNRLVIATADPDNLAALDEIKAATRVREVKPLVARPAAVKAAIARAYDDETYAFTDLLRARPSDFGAIELGDPFRPEAAVRPAPRAAEPAARAPQRPVEPRPREASPLPPPRQPPREPPPPRQPPREPEPAPYRAAPAPARPEPAARPDRLSAEPRPVSRGPAPRAPVQPPHGAALDDGMDLDDPFGAAPQRRAALAAERRPAAARPAESPRAFERAEARYRTSDDALVGAGPALAAPRTPRIEPERPVAREPEPKPKPEPERAVAERNDPTGAALGRVQLQARVGRAGDREVPPPAPSEPGALPLVGAEGVAFEAPVARRSNDPRAEPASLRPRDQPTLITHRSLPPPPSRLQFGPHARHVSERPPPPSSSIPSLQIVEVLRVLVGLIENEREDLRGHSSFVARLAQDAAERIRLPEDQAQAVVVAAYLHDIGKRALVSAGKNKDETAPTVLHLTALNVAQFKPHKELAQKLLRLPEQLMAAAGLPEGAFEALRTMYEHFGGGGIPGELSASDIPIAGRILAVAESYADLTQNAGNPYNRVMTPEEAMVELRRHAGVVFDPSVVDVFEHALGGEKILRQLLDDRHRVLIVDSDPEQTLVLQLRLTDQGFDVHLARNTKQARAALAANKFALVVCEIDVEERDAGLFLREEVAKSKPDHPMSWVYLSGRSSSKTAKRAFDLGVDDFIAKGTSPDIVVAKLVQIVERQAAAKPEPKKEEASRGVSGSLSDMGVTDLIQVLWHGRRTCALHIETDETQGELHFSEGTLVHATWGDATGEKAFYRLIAYSENGRFRVDPSFVPSGEPTIHGSPEGMLLEAMRLIDEKIVP